MSDEPNKPTAPDEPNNPTLPDKPNNPTAPDESNNPTVPDEINNPTAPHEPNNPTAPEESNNPTAPHEPINPAVLHEINNPTAPDEPNNPTAPDESNNPTAPHEPNNPTEPEEPNNPTAPDEDMSTEEQKEINNPTAPQEPNNLNAPEEPNNPTEPEEPNNPTAPDEDMSTEEQKEIKLENQEANGILAKLAADYDEESVDSESDSSSGSYSSSNSSSSWSDSEVESPCEGPDLVIVNGNNTETMVVTVEKTIEDAETQVPMEEIVEGLPLNGIEKSSEIEDEQKMMTTPDLKEADIPACNGMTLQGYRSRKSSTSSSSSYGSEASVKLSSDDSDDEDMEKGKEPGSNSNGTASVKRKKQPNYKDALGLGELEPIVDLQISVPENKVEPIGVVTNILGCLVNVESFENKPALDLSTVLFLDEGKKAMGQVFEVYGRTRQPFYCVRFNSPEHVKEKGIEVGTIVYAAPGTEHTRYVFLAQLERLRATDASWKDDSEVPDEFADYSDDEMEKVAKNKGRKPRPRKLNPINRSFPPAAPQQCEVPNGNRFARKRNFGYQNSGGPPPGMNGFGGPPMNNFYGGYPPRGPPRFDGHMNGQFPSMGMGQRGYYPPQPNNFFGNSYDQNGHYGSPGYPSQAPPPPQNPFSVGGAAVSYRPPFGNYYNNYNYNQAYQQQPQYPSNYWNPSQPPMQYNQQSAWPGYQFQYAMPNFGVPPPSQQPTPSTQSMYSSGPVMPSAVSIPAVYSSGPVMTTPANSTSASVATTATPAVYSAPPTVYTAPKVVYSAGPVKTEQSKLTAATTS